jgi:hypothetical protein
MPGMIKSKAQQSYLAIHKPKVLHELSGGHIPKGLPYRAGGGKKSGGSPMTMNHMFGGGK